MNFFRLLGSISHRSSAIMETPYLTHITSEEFNDVYEPAEDSFLLLDALEADLSLLIDANPLVCVEIGSGSGVIITAVAKSLRETACFAVDINSRACAITKRTAKVNEANLQVINMDLLNGFRPNSVDVLIFNPPYVVTTDEELVEEHGACGGAFNANIKKSWAGGIHGRRIMDKVFERLDCILTMKGVAYVLIIEENKPNEIIFKLSEFKFDAAIVAERRIQGEHLYVMKIQRKLMNLQ